MWALAVAVVSLLVGAVCRPLDDLSRVVNFGALTGFVLLHLSVISHYFFRHRSGSGCGTSSFPWRD